MSNSILEPLFYNKNKYYNSVIKLSNEKKIICGRGDQNDYKLISLLPMSISRYINI